MPPPSDPIAPAPEPFSTRGTDGVRIVSDRLGDPAAPAVVFLHGGGQTRRSWSRAAAAVAKRGWQAVAIDFRGHGESDWAEDGDYRVTAFAADVIQVLHQLPPRPVLVGNLDRLHAAVATIVDAGVPMLLVGGQMSDPVTEEFLARLPRVDSVDAGGAGHMVAGDRNDVFADAVLGFLARHAGQR